MRKLKVCYTIRDNLGDAINPFIFTNVLNCDIICTNEYKCDISGIGSGLRRFFIENKNFETNKKMIRGLLHPKKVLLFSAGFLSTPTGKERLLRKNIEIVSVRGELSRKWIAKILHKQINCGTGDAGLLACFLLKDEVIKKEYDVGIISHDKERQEQFYFELEKSIPNSVVIDVRGDVLNILRKIASCRTIISSSLHDLIIADSFFIPNLHVKLTNNLSGDGFKFEDYYSCFGLNDYCVDLNDNLEITMQSIIQKYRLTKEMVIKKQQEILNDFEVIRKKKSI